MNKFKSLNELQYNSFRDIAAREQDIELYEFNKAIQILEYLNENTLDEGILGDIMSKLSSGIKKKLDFIREVAKAAKQDLTKIIELFKDSRFFKIFKTIGFSIKKLVNLFKLGVKTYNNLQDILAEKIAELGGVKYIRKNLHLLDEWFNEHPVLKKIGGFAVAGLLLYIWLNMSFSPDLEFSMDFKDIISALAGHFSLANLFASPSGITMLIYLAAGVVAGVSMPWPGTTTVHIVGGLIFSAWRLLDTGKIKLEKPTSPKIGKYPKVSFN